MAVQFLKSKNGCDTWNVSHNISMCENYLEKPVTAVPTTQLKYVQSTDYKK